MSYQPCLWIKRTARLSFLFSCLALSSLSASAAPWLDANNLYLRSDLQVLSDAHLIQAPLNTFPLRWSHINSQLDQIDVTRLPPALRQAYDHVLYMSYGASTDRGNRRLKLSYSEDPRQDASFAASQTQKWQVLSSYELTTTHYAFRLAANYQRLPNKYGHQQDQVSLDHSYFAFSVGPASIEIGSRQRWWGPSWINSLAWGHTQGTIPGIDIAFDGYDTPVIGSWHIESFIGHLNTPSANNKQWSSRFEMSPASWLDIGGGYQRWYHKSGLLGYVNGLSSASRPTTEQYHGDIRLSLPAFNVGSSTLTQSLYTQAATLDNRHQLGAVIYGWQSQFNLGQQYFRFIAETKQLTQDGQDAWLQAYRNHHILSGLNHDLAINNSDQGESKTLKLLWVTPNGWNWTAQAQRYQNHELIDHDKWTATLSIPWANNRFTFGGDFHQDPEPGVNQWNYWGSWDFRF